MVLEAGGRSEIGVSGEDTVAPKCGVNFQLDRRPDAVECC